MAGAVRQQIDVASLERYVDRNLPDIRVPLEVKQVFTTHSGPYLLTAVR